LTEDEKKRFGSSLVSGFDVDTKTTSWFNGVKIADTGIGATNWLTQFSMLYAGVSDDAIANFYFDSGSNSPTVPGSPSTTLAALIFGTPANSAGPTPSSWLGQFITNNDLAPGLGTQNPATGVYNGYRISPTSGTKIQIYMPVYWLKQFFQQFILPNLATIESSFPCPAATCKVGTTGTLATAYTSTLVRTGTGSIDVAASGDVNLTNGNGTRNVINNAGSVSATVQAGGTAIYTAGHPAITSTHVVADPDTGDLVTIDLSNALTTSSNLSGAASYGYGTKVGSFVTSIPGVLIADPAEGGGDVAVVAGGDVLGRRDAWLWQSLAATYTTNAPLPGSVLPTNPGDRVPSAARP